MDALDEYDLRAKGGGDALDAFDARKPAAQGLTPERRAKLQAGIDKQRAKVAALNAEPDGVMSSLKGMGTEILHAGEALADKFGNAATLGGWRALQRAVAPKVADLSQQRENELESNAGGRLAGGMMSATGGGVGVPGAVFSKLAAPATQAIANPLLRAAARGFIGGGVTGVTQAAVVDRAPAKEQLTRGLSEGLTGAAADVGLTGLGEAGRAIRNGAGGQARQLIERYGGKVSPTDSGSGGAFDQELKGMTGTDRDIGEVAQRSGQQVLEGTDRIHQERVRGPYAAEKAPIDAAQGQKPVPVDDVHQALMEVYQSPRLTEGQRGVIRSEIDSLDKRYMRPEMGIRIMTESQLNDYKTMLNNLSRAGQAGTHSIPEAELGKVADLVRDKVNQGPYADLNAKYHEGMLERSDVRQALGLGPKESRNEMADATRVRNVLGRQTQDTTTAGATTMDLPQLKQNYPELQRPIELPEVLAAKDDLTFRSGARGHGGLIARMPVGVGLGASTALALSHQSPAASLLPVAGQFIARNTAPIAGRLLYNPAGGAEALGRDDIPDLKTGTNPLLRAMLEQQAKKAALAARLHAFFGAGR